MERTRMLGTEQAVVGGTEGGRSPTGVPPTTAPAAATPRALVPEAPAAAGAKPIPDPAVSHILGVAILPMNHTLHQRNP